MISTMSGNNILPAPSLKLSQEDVQGLDLDSHEELSSSLFKDGLGAAFQSLDYYELARSVLSGKILSSAINSSKIAWENSDVDITGFANKASDKFLSLLTENQSKSLKESFNESPKAMVDKMSELTSNDLGDEFKGSVDAVASSDKEALLNEQLEEVFANQEIVIKRLVELEIESDNELEMKNQDQ